MDTSAGKYDKRIKVMQPNRSANSMNEQVPAYDVVFCKRWAHRVPSSAREFVQAQQVEGLVSAIYRLRSDEKTRAITTDMRIDNGGTVVNIGGAFEDTVGTQREVVLWCTEVAT